MFMKVHSEYGKHAQQEDRDNKVGELKTLKGILIPVDWDEEGNVTAIALSTREELEYLVDNEGRGKALLPHIRQEIELRGTVKEVRDRKIITVQEVRLKSASE